MHALGTYLVKWGRLAKLDDGIQIHRFMSLLTPQENVTLFTQFPVQQRQQAGNLDMAFLLQTVSKIMQLERTSAAGSRRSSGARVASSHPVPTRGVLQVPLEEDGVSDQESTLGDLPKSILAITKTTDRWASPPSTIGAASTSSGVTPSGTVAPSSLGPSASRIGSADYLLFKRMEDFMDKRLTESQAALEKKLEDLKVARSRSPGRNDHLTCFNCGVKGHPASRCNQRRGRFADALACLNCGGAGHRGDTCPHPRRTGALINEPWYGSLSA